MADHTEVLSCVEWRFLPLRPKYVADLVARQPGLEQLCSCLRLYVWVWSAHGLQVDQYTPPVISNRQCRAVQTLPQCLHKVWLLLYA